MLLIWLTIKHIIIWLDFFLLFDHSSKCDTWTEQRDTEQKQKAESKKKKKNLNWAHG